MRKGDFPWVLLIITPEQSYLVSAFMRYSNVVPFFINPWEKKHAVHRILGYTANKFNFENLNLRKLQKITNPYHNIQTSRYHLRIKPEEIDMVFVSDPVVCNFDFKKYKNATKVYWAVDGLYPSVFKTHTLGMDLSSYDIVFVAHENALGPYQNYTNAKTIWLPMYFIPELHKFKSCEKIYDVSFVGNINLDKKRNLIFKKLKNELTGCKLFFDTAWQHRMVDIFNKSKIVLNISRLGEINFRDFETLGCGQFLIRDKSKMITQLFENNHHLVLYDDADHLIELIKDFLEDDPKRERIRIQGFKEAQSKHSINNRIQKILSNIR